MERDSKFRSLTRRLPSFVEYIAKQSFFLYLASLVIHAYAYWFYKIDCVPLRKIKIRKLL